MDTTQSQEFEQLWYTSSKYGLGTMAVGHRIRAASSGLSDLKTPLVQMLEPYLQYILPDGVDGFDTPPEQAALSLSLADLAGYGRILVNKRYTGRDAGGRASLFFSHLLYSHSPAAFQAKDAILLWRAPFWRLSDEGQGSSTVLPHLSEREAPQEYADYLNGPSQGRYEGKYEGAAFRPDAHPRWAKPDFRKIQACLRFVFSAYLAGQQGYQQIYLAAHPDVVADVLFGLTRCLPRPLLSKLTFSTYERNVEGTPFLLVGTCWDQQTRSTRDLPVACYTEHLAYNTYSGKQSQLPEEPLVQHFVDYAVDCLMSENFGELDRLIDKLEGLSNLNVRTFLQYYRQIIVEAQTPTREGVRGCFETPDTAADFLSRQAVQNFIIDEAIKAPEWCANILKPGLQFLFAERAKYQGLTEALAAFAMVISRKTMHCIDSWYRKGAANAGYTESFIVLLEMLSCIASSKSDAWHRQPEILLHPQKEQIFLQFVKQYQNVYFTLLGYWAKLDPPFDVQRIQPLLELNLVQDRLPDFYAAALPVPWKRWVTEQVIRSSLPSLPPEPSQRDYEELISYYSRVNWSTAADIFIILLNRGYPYSFNLLDILLNSEVIPPGGFAHLSKCVPPNASDQVYILKRYGPKFLPIPEDERAMLHLLGHFSKSPQAEFTQKQDILRSWLNSSLTRWLVQSDNLDKVLKQVKLAIPSESNWFVEEFGSTPLISQTPSTMVDEYNRQYLENLDPRKLGKGGYLEYLEQNPDILQKLPQVTRQGVQNQFKLNRLLKTPSFRVQDLRAFNEAVYQRGIEKNIEEREKLAWQLVNPLATAFALRVETDTHLSALAQLLDSAFKPFTFQIFYRMAEIIRDGLAQQETKMSYRIYLKPYIRFALSSDSAFELSDRNYIQFSYTLLDLLLQSTSESEIQQLDLETGGGTMRRWHDYKTGRSNPAVADGARSGNAPFPSANQSQGGSMIQTAASGGRSASNAMASQSNQSRQPYQYQAAQSAQTQQPQQQTQLSNGSRGFFSRFGWFRPVDSPPPLKKNKKKQINTHNSNSW